MYFKDFPGSLNRNNSPSHSCSTANGVRGTPRRPHRHKIPTNDGFCNRICLGPWASLEDPSVYVAFGAPTSGTAPALYPRCPRGRYAPLSEATSCMGDPDALAHNSFGSAAAPYEPGSRLLLQGARQGLCGILINVLIGCI